MSKNIVKVYLKAYDYILCIPIIYFKHKNTKIMQFHLRIGISSSA